MNRLLCRIVIYLLPLLACILAAVRSAGPQDIGNAIITSHYDPSIREFSTGINVICNRERVLSTWSDYVKPPLVHYFTVSSVDEFESMSSKDIIRACFATQEVKPTCWFSRFSEAMWLHFAPRIDVLIPDCALTPTSKAPEYIAKSLIITAGLAMIVWIGFKILNRQSPRASLPAGPSKVYLNSFDRMSFVIVGYGIVAIEKSLATLEVPWQCYNVEALAELEGPIWYIKEKDSFPDCLSTEVQKLLQPHINTAWPTQIASLSVFNRRPGSSRAVPGPIFDIPEDPLLPKRIVAEGNASVAEEPVEPLEDEPVFHHEEDELVDVEPAEGVEESVEPLEDEPVFHHEEDEPVEVEPAEGVEEPVEPVKNEPVFDHETHEAHEAHELAAQKKRISALDPLVQECWTGFAMVKSELFSEESEPGLKEAMDALYATEPDPRIRIIAQVTEWRHLAQVPGIAEDLLSNAAYYRPRLLESISHLVATRMDMFRNHEAMDTLKAILDSHTDEDASQMLYLQKTFQTLVGIFDKYEEDPSELGPEFVQVLTECIGIGENEPTPESIVEALWQQADKHDHLQGRVEEHTVRASVARPSGRDLDEDILNDAQDIYNTVREQIFEAEQIAYRVVLLSYCVNIFDEVEMRPRRQHESPN